MRRVRIVLLAFLVCHLQACSLFSPIPTQEENVYEIHINTQAKPAHQLKGKVYLSPIKAYPGLNTSRMRYQIKPYQVDYFSKNRWVAPPTVMLQPLVYANLQSLFQQAASYDDDSANYQLNLTVREFEQDFRCYVNGEFTVSIQAEWLDKKTGTRLGDHRFNYTQTSCPASPYGGVLAANALCERFLQDLDNWLRAETK